MKGKLIQSSDKGRAGMERKEEILNAAGKLFAHYGMKKTTIADIAEEVGIGTGSVYLEFSSKEAIACGLASRQHQQIIDGLRRILEANAPLSERVVQFFEERTALFEKTCSRGKNAVDLLRCGGKEKAPWMEFRAKQLRMLAEAIGDEGLALGLLAAYSAFEPRPGHVHNAMAFAELNRLVRLALENQEVNSKSNQD
jgi:AcrR family transcriptional regulator